MICIIDLNDRQKLIKNKQWCIYGIIKSSPESLWWFSWEFESFNADQGAILINWIVYVWQILQGRSLSDSSELVVNWTVANADVSIVVTQIWDGDTTQMCANSRADKNATFPCWSQYNFRALIENSLMWVFVFLFDLFSRQSSYKDWGSVPDNLDDFGWRQWWDIDFHVSISIVSGPSVHSSNGTNGIKSSEIQHTSVVDGT